MFPGASLDDTTDLTQGESGGNNRAVYVDKHSALYIQEWTKQQKPTDKDRFACFLMSLQPLNAVCVCPIDGTSTRSDLPCTGQQGKGSRADPECTEPMTFGRFHCYPREQGKARQRLCPRLWTHSSA